MIRIEALCRVAVDPKPEYVGRITIGRDRLVAVAAVQAAGEGGLPAGADAASEPDVVDGRA